MEADPTPFQEMVEAATNKRGDQEEEEAPATASEFPPDYSPAGEGKQADQRVTAQP
jgi:hypothetical protein